ncbi:MAG: hypothetical protein FJX29_06340 [Alphaproteobacteria bacterium]|nr:hypothetical protein [Alphaproteobacteria bacterium]
MNVSTAPIPVLRNRMALFGWIFMSIWMGMLAIFTYLFRRGYLRTPDGREVRLKESPMPQVVQQARAQLLAALRLESAA